MTREQLISQILNKKTYLCVGLDPDPAKLPEPFRSTPDITGFCRAIVEATEPYCVAYKLNIAFFESLGRHGWDILYETRALLPSDCLLIADAKRADVGNTSDKYARAFFKELQFDAVTVAPYMGEDSVRPFLEYSDKWTIMLGLTSNSGAGDFQMQPLANGLALYEHVLQTARGWGDAHRMMFVAGATQPQHLARVRELLPDYFLLIPGVGAQGGDLTRVSEQCMIPDVGMLVNSSREILYASSGEDFADAARNKAAAHARTMAALLP